MRTKIAPFFFLSITVVLFVANCRPQPVTALVETHLGPVRGQQVNDGKVLAFKGIPFAESTAGANRWKAPVPPAPWKEPFVADKFGKACPQFSVPPNTTLPGIIGDEDCLNLNVWTPAGLKTDAGLPVIVFIYGGGFLNGFDAIPLYDGAYLAERHNVVIVNFNYRVGAFGFLALDELEGNYGFLDQLLAMQWVRRNIENFGGDPDRVTLMGESAGAISVGVHLTNARSREYFRAAISESNPYGIPIKTLAEARTLGGQFSKLALCLDEAKRVDCLRKKSAKELVVIQQLYAALPLLFGTGIDKALAWAPNIDGTLLKTQPAAELIEKPLLIGTNKNEGVLFVSPLDIPIPAGLYRVVLSRLFDSAQVEKILARFPPQGNNMEQTTRIATEYGFTCANRYVARRARGDVFLYQFRHNPTDNYLKIPRCKGRACHASELPFVFHYRPFLTGGPPELKLSEAMGLYWTNFAKDLDPGTAGGLAWPEFNPADDYLFLNLELKTRPDPFEEACSFWDEIGYYQREKVWERMLDLRSETLSKQLEDLVKP